MSGPKPNPPLAMIAAWAAHHKHILVVIHVASEQLVPINANTHGRSSDKQTLLHDDIAIY
jgi:hypothetical protein